MKKMFLQFFLMLAFVVFQAGTGYAAFPIKSTEPAPVQVTAATGHAQQVQAQHTATVKEAPPAVPAPQTGGKSQLVALLLGIFLGWLGIHRFYLGYTWQGIVQLLTAGGFGIWWIIDVIRIAIGDLQPKNGSYSDTL